VTQYFPKPSPERVVQVPGPEGLVRVPVPLSGPVRLVHVEPPSVPKKRIGLGTNDGKSAGKSNLGTRNTAIPQNSVMTTREAHKFRFFVVVFIPRCVCLCVCLCVHVTTGVLLKRSSNTPGMILVEEIVPGFACGKAPFSNHFRLCMWYGRNPDGRNMRSVSYWHSIKFFW